jgi:hypothetical protein
MNYIKRLVGQPGETIAIYYGDLYRTTDLHYDKLAPTPENGFLRRSEAVFTDDRRAQDLFRSQVDAQFETKGFEIIRKGPDKILALRRIVFDNDFQAEDQKHKPPRWSGAGAWQGDGPRKIKHPYPTPGPRSTG